jgi:hypothetical protein
VAAQAAGLVVVVETVSRVSMTRTKSWAERVHAGLAVKVDEGAVGICIAGSMANGGCEQQIVQHSCVSTVCLLLWIMCPGPYVPV